MKNHETLTNLFLIRHSQPLLEKAILGSTDSPLSNFGMSQLEVIGKQLKDIELVISSPLLRCVSFAKKYAEINQVKAIVDKNWQ